MGIESIKTFILTFLILLSLVMTWGLWSYQPKYDLVQNTRLLQNVALGEKKDINEVIEPLQMIVYQEDTYKGTTNRKDLQPILKHMEKWGFPTVSNQSLDVKRNQVPDLLPEKDYIEMVYPTSIPIDIFASLFELDQDTVDLKAVDRIFIPIQPELNKSTSIYLFSTKEEILVEVGLEENDFASFQLGFQKELDTLVSMVPYDVGNGDVLFLPETRVKEESITYSTQSISVMSFRNALFNEPNIVRQYRTNNGEESFTDGARALEVFYSQNRIRFVNPSQEMYNMEPSEVIVNSINFINEHAGWTDTYMFYQFDQTNQSTSFRLFVDGLPVFGLNNVSASGSIKQTWRNHEIYEYSRSLLDLRFALQNQRHVTILPSGKELLDLLKNQKDGFSLERLQKAVIGYSALNENSVLLSFEPAWFILYDGVWERVNIPYQGGDINGLE